MVSHKQFVVDGYQNVGLKLDRVKMNNSKIIEINGRFFFFKSAPHLTAGADWHSAYIDIVDRFLNAPSTLERPTELPAYPLAFDTPGREIALEFDMEPVFEMGSYWEGALYFLCRVIDARDPLDGIRHIEYSYRAGSANYLEKLFMAIWNSHGQLKWLKAFFIRNNVCNEGLLGRGGDYTLSSEKLYEAGVKHQNKELLWLSSFVCQHEEEGGKYPNPYFGGGNSLHLGLIFNYKKSREFHL